MWLGRIPRGAVSLTQHPPAVFLEGTILRPLRVVVVSCLAVGVLSGSVVAQAAVTGSPRSGANGTSRAASGGSGGGQPHGPDVASYQHPNGAGIDWSRVHDSGSAFTFVKATEGTSYTNPHFASDYAAAHRVGLVRSAYHYARPYTDPQTAQDQAQAFVKTAGTAANKGDLPLTLDLEESGGLSPSQLISWVQAFVAQVRTLTHRPPILYTYPYFWQHAMANSSAFTSLPLWIASYRSGGPQTPLPGGWKTWTFWQYTSSAAVPGISGPVDASMFSGSAAALNKLADPTQPPTPMPGGDPNDPLPIPLPITLPIHPPIHPPLTVPSLPDLPEHPNLPTSHNNHAY
jgi:lysozyme